MATVAWDTIDSRISSNVLRLVGKELDWHGTVLISTQMPGTSPLFSQNAFHNVNIAKYRSPSKVVDAYVEDTTANKKT